MKLSIYYLLVSLYFLNYSKMPKNLSDEEILFFYNKCQNDLFFFFIVVHLYFPYSNFVEHHYFTGSSSKRVKKVFILSWIVCSVHTCLKEEFFAFAKEFEQTYSLKTVRIIIHFFNKKEFKWDDFEFINIYFAVYHTIQFGMISLFHCLVYSNEWNKMLLLWS